jgi:hypothetical protein
VVKTRTSSDNGKTWSAAATIASPATGFWYAWYRAAITESELASSQIASAAQKAKTNQVKDLLGKAIASGEKFLREQNDKDADQAESDAQSVGVFR